MYTYWNWDIDDTVLLKESLKIAYVIQSYFLKYVCWYFMYIEYIYSMYAYVFYTYMYIYAFYIYIFI